MGIMYTNPMNRNGIISRLIFLMANWTKEFIFVVFANKKPDKEKKSGIWNKLMNSFM